VIVLIVDLAIMLVLARLAARSKPDHVEVEAKLVRQRALEQITESAALGVAIPTLGMAIGR
jgi:hypothetical protein